MNKDFLAAVRQLATEKNIEEEVIISAVSAAIMTAYRKDYGNKDQELEVYFDGGNLDSIAIFLLKEVVETVEEEDYEISLKEAKKMKKDCELGDEIKIDVTPIGYGRIATQSAKQVILQKINEAEKIAVFNYFKDKEGEVVYGTINRVEGTHITVDVNKNLLNLHYKSQIRNEQYFNGKRFCFYVYKVEMTNRGPKIVVSRTSKGLVGKLLEKEIPEIAEGDIEIKGIGRDPGNRSKVAVYTENDKIDVIGACVGFKGSRINVVIDELGGERIDMIEWDENPAKFIAKTLQPAMISKVIIINAEDYKDEEEGRIIKKRAAVFVSDEDRAKAIGKRGQNIKLASEITGYELDMYDIAELPLFEAKLEEMKQEVISYEAEVEETEEEKGPRSIK